jgi:hypothetical protein
MKIKQKGGDSKRMETNAIALPHLSDTLLAAKMGREIKLLVTAMAITTVTVFATGLPGLSLAMNNDVLACEGNLCNDNRGVPLDDSGQTTAICGDGTGTICVPPDYICEKAVHLPACNPEY